MKRWMTAFFWIMGVLFLVSCQKAEPVFFPESSETAIAEPETGESRNIEKSEKDLSFSHEEQGKEKEKAMLSQNEKKWREIRSKESAEGELPEETSAEGSTSEENEQNPAESSTAGPGNGSSENEQERPAYEEPPAAEPQPEPEQSRAAGLNAAAGVSQLILVEASGTQAVVTMHQKNGEGLWEEIYRTSGYVGREGVGVASEYSAVTPAGVYTLGPIFGNEPDPGCPRGYIQVDDTYYWVDDVNSVYYNQMVSTRTEGIDTSAFSSAEHLCEDPADYAYVAAINYNTDCVPGAGSAMFLHVTHGAASSGCIGIPRDAMIFILTHLASDTRIVIGNASGAFALDQY